MNFFYLIAGCNGAGKKTSSFMFFPSFFDCKYFVNADEIAKGLSPFTPDEMAIQAGKLMIQRIQELIKKGETFAVETTLSSKMYLRILKELKLKGYQTHLIFFWLNSPPTGLSKSSQKGC